MYNGHCGVRGGRCPLSPPSGSATALESTTDNTNTCKHAFLAERRWLESNKTDPSNDVQYLDYVPVALEWTIPNSTFIINLTFAEEGRRNMYLDYTSYGAKYYYCRYGYEGNPYLNMRCQGKLLLPTPSIFPNFLHYMPNFDSYIDYFRLI